MRRGIPFFRGAFTLIELLVVVAIIVVLIAILLPAMSHFSKLADKAAATAQLSALRTGLSAYYSDFNMYPPSAPTAPIPPGLLANRGDRMLAQGLLGFLPGSVAGNGPGGDGAGTSLGDVNDFGFRLTPNAAAMGGRIYGPYAPSDAKNYDNGNRRFIDPWKNPVLYYRSSRSLPGTTMDLVTTIFGDPAANTSFFGKDDCKDCTTNVGSAATAPPPASSTAFFGLIGATNNTAGGLISGGNSYLLISAGPDEKYFTADDIVVSK